ncbi:MAG: polyprenyl synthetase family protein [Halobacteriales archaeon]|nr:polyprenyl synthetase family protein [Halobacteriales archaeon]
MQSLTLDLESAMRDVEQLLAASCSSDEPLLTEMARRMVLAGGKRIRPRIMLLSYMACGARQALPELIEAAAGIELIHTATLVHDDIIDRGELRRGVPATQREHGPDRAIILGDFLFTQGFLLSARQDAEVVRLTGAACRKLAEGELKELQALFDADLSLERYMDIIFCKTAAPLEACGRVGAHFAGRDEWQDALGAYGKHLGLAFQVSDDLLDLRGDPARTGKPRGTDLRSGAPNAAVLLGARNGARAKMQEFLAKRVRTEEDVQAALDALARSGAAQEAQRLAEEHAARAVEALSPLPDSPAKRELLAQVRALPVRPA